MVRIVDEEGHLGGIGARIPLVACDRHQLVVQFGDEGHPIHVVDLGEVAQLAIAQPWTR